MCAPSTWSPALFCRLLLASQQNQENNGARAIVNIASVSGLVGIKQRFAYCTSKGAVVAMTRQLAVDYPKTLRVNAICPGTVETPFVEGYLEKFHKHNKEETRAELRARQPIGRSGSRMRLRPWCAIWRPTKPPSSPAQSSPSTAAGPPPELCTPSRIYLRIGAR
jgi:NAD(P)-dependent dehydrogenase (short-subunit alcohol dehydrogenase family)